MRLQRAISHPQGRILTVTLSALWAPTRAALTSRHMLYQTTSRNTSIFISSSTIKKVSLYNLPFTTSSHRAESVDFDDFVRKFKEAQNGLPKTLSRTSSLSPSSSTSRQELDPTSRQELDSTSRHELDSYLIEPRPPDPVELPGDSSCRPVSSLSPTIIARRSASHHLAGRHPTSP